MKKIALIVGHNEKSKGAYSEYLKISEYDFFTKVLDELFDKYDEVFNLDDNFIKNIKDHVSLFRVPNTGYSKEMAEVVKELADKKFDIAIELHFNATASHNQHGNTVLYWHKSEEGKRLSDLFQDIMTKKTGIRKLDLIQIKSLDQNGAYGIIKSKCPYILLEPFFGDNKIDTDKISIELMAEVLFEFLNTINDVKLPIQQETDLKKENEKLRTALLNAKNIIDGALR
ncbi:N-acetylmuramoyl-L-alanine amidase [Cetobacterium sp.]|uniref:N-acetylmuramoyl-L-alanine amidase n=1 Tax=Cetobacterium sp. TaxID=2071632 RepID=UPI003F2D7AE7